jgi:DNA-binding winged helix-turn-helix (wHTH) protein
MADSNHNSGIISFGPYTLIAARRRLERAGRPVPLGDHEFDLLCALIARAGEVVTYQELIARIWGESTMGKGRLRVHINALRRALYHYGIQYQCIGKVAKRGYVFTAPISRNTGSGGEGNGSLWDGRIIDATLPPT